MTTKVQKIENKPTSCPREGQDTIRSMSLVRTLDTRIDFHKVMLSILVDQEFNSPGITIIGRSQQTYGITQNGTPCRFGQAFGWTVCVCDMETQCQKILSTRRRQYIYIYILIEYK